MTLAEFKAWFEGFSEGIDKVPTEKQFAKIKAKVAQIDGAPTTYPVFVDRYWPRRSQWEPLVTFTTSGYSTIDPASKGDNQTMVWNAQEAMNALGRADAMN